MLKRLLERDFGVSQFGLEYNNNMNISGLNSLDGLTHIQLTFPSLTSWLPLKDLSSSIEIHLHSQTPSDEQSLDYLKNQVEYFRKVRKSKVKLIEHFLFNSKEAIDFQNLRAHRRYLEKIKKLVSVLYIENLPVTESVDRYYEEFFNTAKMLSIPIALDVPHLIISANAANKGLEWIKDKINSKHIGILHVAGLKNARGTICDSHSQLNLSYLNSLREFLGQKQITLENDSNFDINTIIKTLSNRENIDLSKGYKTQSYSDLLKNLELQSNKFFTGETKSKCLLESKCSGIFKDLTTIYPFSDNIFQLSESSVNDLKKMFRVIGRNLRLVKNSIFPLTESLKFDIKVSDITRDHDSKMEIKKQLGTWTINIENKSKIQIIAFN